MHEYRAQAFSIRFSVLLRTEIVNPLRCLACRHQHFHSRVDCELTKTNKQKNYLDDPDIPDHVTPSPNIRYTLFGRWETFGSRWGLLSPAYGRIRSQQPYLGKR